MANINLSGTITTGGVAQILDSARGQRNGIRIRNNSVLSLWINWFGTATTAQPSLEIKTGEIFVTNLGEAPTGQISIIGSTTGQEFTAWSW